jgi:hypothetical protein
MARLRLRSVLPSPWNISRDHNNLRIRSGEIGGVWSIPLHDVGYSTLLDAVADDQFSDFDTDLARAPNSLEVNRRWGWPVNNQELVFWVPQPRPNVHNIDTRDDLVDSFGAIDSILFSASPRKAATFFEKAGVPLRLDVFAAMGETIGTRAHPDPQTAKEIADYRVGVDLETVRVRRARKRLAIACIPLIGCLAYLFVSAPIPGSSPLNVLMVASFSASLIVFPVMIALAYRELRKRRAIRIEGTTLGSSDLR